MYFRRFILLLFVCVAQQGLAHNIKIFAASEDGKRISGYVYFAGGARFKQAPIKVLDPNGKVLVELKADQKGEFSFLAKARIDHHIMLNSGDHAAEWKVSASELSNSLDAPKHNQKNSPKQKVEPTVEVGESSGSLVSELRTLRSQVIKMREELEAYQASMRLRDVLGGIGYIFGLFGVAFYILGRRSK